MNLLNYNANYTLELEYLNIRIRIYNNLLTRRRCYDCDENHAHFDLKMIFAEFTQFMKK